MDRTMERYISRSAEAENIPVDKNIVAVIFLKNGKAVRSFDDMTCIGDVYELAKLYNDSGVDKLIIFDLSTEEDDHEKNIHVIQNINRNIELRVCAGGNINRIDDVKKLFYAGCKQVILNASKGSSMGMAEMISAKFGKDSVLLSVKTMDFIFKNQRKLDDTFHELLIMDPIISDAIEHMTEVPQIIYLPDDDHVSMVSYLRRERVRGIAGDFINDPMTDIMKLKTTLTTDGIVMDNFAPELGWEDLRPNAAGMVPVIAQDYRTDEILMLGYMNEEAFYTTITLGKMTYVNEEGELIVTGEDSAHYQYVKSLTADTSYHTILAKVSQLGVMTETGTHTTFCHDIVRKEYVDKNPLTVLETVYNDIKQRELKPFEGSYTNSLLLKGMDEILKKLGSEAAEIIIAAKNPDNDKVKYEISDFLYHCMVLMAQKNITWEDVTQELAQR